MKFQYFKACFPFSFHSQDTIVRQGPGLYRLRHPSRASAPEVGEAGLRVHPDGRGGVRTGQVHPHQQPLPGGSLQEPTDAQCGGAHREDDEGGEEDHGH